MSKVEQARRSRRLKNKPMPKYVLNNIQKDVNTVLRQMDEFERMQKPLMSNAKIEAAVKSSRKYDDIFTAVVGQAKLKVPKRTAMSSESSESSPECSNAPDEPEAPKKRKIVENEQEDEIQVLAELFTCNCGSQFQNHADCHNHIIMEHDDTELDVHCSTCGLRLEELRTRHMCHICGSFADDLNAHIVMHYRNCTSKSAVMECRFCVRQFLTVREVVEHEKQKHMKRSVIKPVQYYNCNECSVTFTNQEALTVHYMSHLNVALLFETIEELQYKVDAVKEECPFCRTHVGSRKTFRAHILKQHYQACKSLASHPTAAQATPPSNLVEVKREVNEIVESAEIQDAPKEFQVKQEVKEELEDDGYPKC